MRWKSTLTLSETALLSGVYNGGLVYTLIQTCTRRSKDLSACEEKLKVFEAERSDIREELRQWKNQVSIPLVEIMYPSGEIMLGNSQAEASNTTAESEKKANMRLKEEVQRLQDELDAAKDKADSSFRHSM